jgi:aquaporin Z
MTPELTQTPTTGQKVAAEVIGTFVLVFFGCSAAILSHDYVAIALAFGLTVLVGAYAFGRVSGAHFNPAVTVGAAIGGRLAWRQTPVYIASQLVGALLAGLTLFLLVHGFEDYDVSRDGLGQNFFGHPGGLAWWAALILETLMTAVFLWVILAVTDARNEHPALAPAAIGLALTMIHLASITATGTSVNPARSIGVGVYAGTDAIKDLWLFILAPLLGGALAGLTYPLLFGHGTEPVAGSGLRFGRASAGAVPGYGAPDQFQQEWNQPDGVAVTHQHQNWEQEPIIQDGWQWDYEAQEWKPLEHWEPAEPTIGATGHEGGWSQADSQTTEQSESQPWSGDPDSGQTQIRPPQ